MLENLLNTVKEDEHILLSLIELAGRGSKRCVICGRMRMELDAQRDVCVVCFLSLLQTPASVIKEAKAKAWIAHNGKKAHFLNKLFKAKRAIEKSGKDKELFDEFKELV